MQQLELFGAAAPLPPRFASFVEFHRDNPTVWTMFQRFAQEALSAGRKIGARAIGERIRWEVTIKTTGEEFKVNDHFWPYYARLLMLTDDRFDGFFTVKDKRFDADEDMIREHCKCPQQQS